MKKKEDEFIYCAERLCPHHECMRHNKWIPYNVKVLVEKYTCDKDGNCKHIIVERN